MIQDGVGGFNDGGFLSVTHVRTSRPILALLLLRCFSGGVYDEDSDNMVTPMMVATDMTSVQTLAVRLVEATPVSPTIVRSPEKPKSVTLKGCIRGLSEYWKLLYVKECL